MNRAETPDIKMYKMYEHLTKYAEKAHNWQIYQESLYGQLDYLRKLDDQSSVQFIDIQLGGAEFQAQRYEPAIKLLQEAIKSTKDMQGDAPKLALPYSLLGMCYYRTNKNAEAKAATYL